MRHTKIYMNHFGYGEQDFIPCEMCSSRAVDTHHVLGRGKSMDVIENLMALCRECHNKAHDGDYSKGELLRIHLIKIKKP